MSKDEFVGEVDSVKITVLMDDYSGFIPDILAQHGISIILDLISGNVSKRILFDAGQSAEPILYNMKQLKILPESIDMVILSHCHQDHTSGLVGILKNINREIPIVAHPSIFKCKVACTPFLRYSGISNKNSKEEIIKNGGNLILIKEPLRIMDGVFTTGEIERKTDFELFGKDRYVIENGSKITDTSLDDISLAINIKGKGLLIVTGCSHSGIINIVNQVSKISGMDNVFGILGGMHLIESSPEIIDKTITNLANKNIKFIAPGHCTGINAINRLIEHFDSKVDALHSGKVIFL